MKTIILCGGQGMRLREETEFKPKSLVEIGGLPILWHIMKIYSHYGFNDFVLCLGHKGHIIKDYFLNYENRVSDFTLNLKNKKMTTYNPDIENWNITFANTGLNTNTGGRIKRIEKYINEDNFFLTYGDGVSDINIKQLLKFHQNHKKIGTVLAVKPIARFGLLELEKSSDAVINFSKKTLVHEGRIDGGFMVFKKEFFDYLTPDDICVLEGEPLKKLAKDDQFRAYKHDGFWQCMDTISQANLLNEFWNSNNAPWKVWD
jgi:glucose-1-phosphate cytidylyltransferase